MFVTGAPCSGKTTATRAFQAKYHENTLLFHIDELVRSQPYGKNVFEKTKYSIEDILRRYKNVHNILIIVEGLLFPISEHGDAITKHVRNRLFLCPTLIELDQIKHHCTHRKYMNSTDMKQNILENVNVYKSIAITLGYSIYNGTDELTQKLLSKLNEIGHVDESDSDLFESGTDDDKIYTIREIIDLT